MASGNVALVARILLLSAVLFAALGALVWAGVLPIDPGARRLFAASFGICAVLDAVIGLILLTRFSSSDHDHR